MNMRRPFLKLLNSLILIATTDTFDPRTKDANYHIATSNQMTITKEDGCLVFGSDSGDSYKVESRAKDGEVRGIYGYMLPDGSYKTIAYSAGRHGYKTGPIKTVMPNGLVQFPHDLDGEEDKEVNSMTASKSFENAKSHKSSDTVRLKAFSNDIKHIDNGEQLKSSLIMENGWFWKQPKVTNKSVETNIEASDENILGILSMLMKYFLNG